MRISRISVYQLALPLSKPYWLSGGRLRFDALDSTLVCVETDEGVAGWGEGCPWGSSYLPAFGKGIRAGIDEIAPSLLGLDPRGLDVINRVMDAALPGHLYAKSPLDMACWDVLGKATGLPLCELLGGREAGDVLLHSSISTGTPDDMVGDLEASRHRGYVIHSFKIGADIKLDRERITSISNALLPKEQATFDVNRAWLCDQAIRVMNDMREFGGYYEQPCETLEECSKVRRATQQPMILDECIQTFSDLKRADALSACEAIGLKLGRVGGITRARRMRDFCVAVGLRMNIEETGGSVLADTAAVHLAQSTPETHRRATWLSHDMLSTDVAPGQGARNDHGVTRAPRVPGIGVIPESDRIDAACAVYD